MGRRSAERLFFVEYRVPSLLRAPLYDRANPPGKYADALINGFSRKARYSPGSRLRLLRISSMWHAIH